MQSRNSFFNGALYRKILSRFWPLWVGVTAITCLCPLIYLINGVGHEFYNGFTQDIYATIVSGIGPAFLMGYALVCAMAVWSYLYQSRSVAMMHALPLTRSALFGTGVTAGLTFMLLPLAVAGGFQLILDFAFRQADLVAFFSCAAGLVLMSLLFFGFATLCAMLTGHLLALPVFYLLGNFIAVLVDLLLSLLANQFFLGVNGGRTGVIDFLSPLVQIYSKVHVTTREATFVMDGMGVLLLYGLAGVVLLALSWAVYCRRRSETAGDVVAFRPLQVLFKLGMGLFSILSLGQLLYNLLKINLSGESLPLLGLCLAAAGIVGFWVGDALVQKSARVWRSSAVGALIMAALSLVICLSIRFDVLGVERRIPAPEDVKSVMIGGSHLGSSVEFYGGQDDEMIQAILDLHRTILDNKAQVLNSDMAADWGYLDIHYTLTAGVTVAREYRLPIRWKTDDPEITDVAQALEDLVNTRDFRFRRLHHGEDITLQGCHVWGSREGWAFSASDAQSIYKALLSDAAAGRWGRIDLAEEHLYPEETLPEDRQYLGSLSFDITRKEDSRPIWVGLDCDINSGMTDTLAVLKTLGVDLLNQPPEEDLEPAARPVFA